MRLKRPIILESILSSKKKQVFYHCHLESIVIFIATRDHLSHISVYFANLQDYSSSHRVTGTKRFSSFVQFSLQLKENGADLWKRKQALAKVRGRGFIVLDADHLCLSGNIPVKCIFVQSAIRYMIMFFWLTIVNKPKNKICCQVCWKSLELSTSQSLRFLTMQNFRII